MKDFDSRTALSAASTLRPRLRSERAHEGGRIVFDFALHLVVGFNLHGTDERHGMCGAGGGSGSHGRDVCGFENEDACGARMSARGSDVDDDWHMESW